MNLIFQKKSYSFKLSAKVVNSKTNYHTKSGWIIKLVSNQKIGFGEVSPLHKKDLKKCAKQLDMIPEYVEIFNLSEQISFFHPCIQSAINSALAEIDGKIIFKEKYYFDEIDKTAILLNPENVISDLNKIKKRQSDIGKSLTIKWKVALKNNHCLLYTSPSPRDISGSRMPSSA